MEDFEDDYPNLVTDEVSQRRKPNISDQLAEGNWRQTSGPPLHNLEEDVLGPEERCLPSVTDSSPANPDRIAKLGIRKMSESELNDPKVHNMILALTEPDFYIKYPSLNKMAERFRMDPVKIKRLLVTKEVRNAVLSATRQKIALGVPSAALAVLRRAEITGDPAAFREVQRFIEKEDKDADAGDNTIEHALTGLLEEARKAAQRKREQAEAEETAQRSMVIDIENLNRVGVEEG